MVRQIAFGGFVSLLNIAVHAIAMAAVLKVFRRRVSAAPSLGFQFHLALVMTAVVAVLTAAHLIEVSVWALLYRVIGVAPSTVQPFYFALVNFTTLGYGDVVPMPNWQLIGPLTAMNGILLLGWSTAVMFALLSSQIPSFDDGSHKPTKQARPRLPPIGDAGSSVSTPTVVPFKSGQKHEGSRL